MEQKNLFRETKCYEIFRSDIAKGDVSHAYLLVCADKMFLRDYLKLMAKELLCELECACEHCRTCRLIESESYEDVKIYPAVKGEKIKADDIVELVEESYIKPLENSKKVFIIDITDDMNAVCQNKLLKTLEEPPKNVVILIGAISEFALLPTVKSRVKILKAPNFTDEQITNALKNTYTDQTKLNLAVKNGDGTFGKAIALYEDKKLQTITELCNKIIFQLKKSAEVLEYTIEILALKDDLGEFLAALKLSFWDLSKKSQSELSKRDYTIGAILSIIDRLQTAEKKLYFNGNPTMIIDNLLLGILEEKYKWQKL